MFDTDEFQEPMESLSRSESRRVIYALLFVSDRPVSAARLAEAVGDMDTDVMTLLLEELKAELNAREELPYELQEIAGGYQLSTKALFAPYIRKFLQVKKSGRLSKALLETLAVIAYKQPVTRAEVEAIRGVSVSYAFDQLQEKRLIKISGIAELPGRPKLYRTTEEFLLTFGLKSVNELPALDELRSLD
ncbi:MAG: SMC-Scp complex subunit ScpB [Candidatus Hydrogenedentales bacterium]